jgi:hypothetical protein
LELIYDEFVNDPYKCSFETFEKIYKTATEESYSFLYFDVNNMKFRIKLNKRIEL